MNKIKMVSGDSQILRNISATVSDIGSEVRPFISQMRKIMRKKRGIGLAAPQVGVGRRFFITGIDGIKVCLNPSIVDHGGIGETKEEGCLSFPGEKRRVMRHVQILVKFQDLKGNWHDKGLSGFEARVFQHELDHLDGICIVK